MSRFETFVMRFVWLVFKKMVLSGYLEQKDFDDWQRDYAEAGGANITPAKDSK